MCDKHQKSNMFRVAVVLVAFMVTAKDVMTENVARDRPCCTGDNMFVGRSCRDGSNAPDFNCSNGRFMLDPKVSEFDKYSITKDGLLHNMDSPDQSRYCTTNYLPVGTNESRKVAFVCFDGAEVFETTMMLFMVKGILAIVSVVFIMATLYVYWLIPDLRETQDKVTCIALMCMMLFLMLLSTIQIIMPDHLGPFCAIFGVLLYFFTIAYFAWLNVVMVNVWKSSVMHRWQIKERTWYGLNHLYGWLVPLGLTANVIRYWHFADGFSGNSCWFNEKRDSWIYLYAPISVMLVANVILFFWSAWGIHRTGNDVSPDKKKALTYKFRLYLKLFILAGMTWIFEVLSYQFGSQGISYWLIADVVNGLHGVLIFCVLVLCRRRIRKELAGKRILCCMAPASWSQIDYPEEEQLNDGDDHTKNDLITK